MIACVKKADPKPATEQNDKNRFESIHDAAAERCRNADTDGTWRRARLTAEDNRPT